MLIDYVFDDVESSGGLPTNSTTKRDFETLFSNYVRMQEFFSLESDFSDEEKDAFYQAQSGFYDQYIHMFGEHGEILLLLFVV